MGAPATYGLIQTVAPTTEPITRAEGKTHIRVEIEDDDALIDQAIAAAREWCEGQLERAFITQTWRYVCDTFPVWCDGGKIRLPLGRLQTVSTVKYLDMDGVQQTLNSSLYRVVNTREPGYIEPAINTTWPSTANVSAAVEIVYVCGYGAAANVPATIKQAIALATAWFYENRGDNLEASMGALAGALRMMLMPFSVGTY